MTRTMAANHVTIDEGGTARIDGTRFKVLHLATAVRGGIDSPRELHRHYPQLTIGQICSALAYYYDNQPAFDRQVDAEMTLDEAERAAAPETPGRAKLRALGLRP